MSFIYFPRLFVRRTRRADDKRRGFGCAESKEACKSSRRLRCAGTSGGLRHVQSNHLKSLPVPAKCLRAIVSNFSLFNNACGGGGTKHIKGRPPVHAAAFTSTWSCRENPASSYSLQGLGWVGGWVGGPSFPAPSSLFGACAVTGKVIKRAALWRGKKEVTYRIMHGSSAAAILPGFFFQIYINIYTVEDGCLDPFSAATPLLRKARQCQ